MRLARSETLWCAAFAVLGAWLCTIVYLHVLGDARTGIPAWHQSAMDNRALAPDQYRWLSYAIPELFAGIGLEVGDVYLMLRFVYLATALFIAAQIGLRMGLELQGAAFLIAAIGLYYASATQAHYQPSEEPNLVIYAWFIWLAIVRARFPWFVLVMAIGVLTKDTVGFLLPFYALTAAFVWRRTRRAVIRETAVLSMVFAAGYVGTRMYFGTDRPYLGGLWQADDNIRSLRQIPEQATVWLLAAIVPLVAVLRRWSTTPVVVRCFVPTSILFVIGHLAISKIVEWRTYTPLALVMWPGILVPLFASPAPSGSGPDPAGGPHRPEPSRTPDDDGRVRSRRGRGRGRGRRRSGPGRR